MKSPVMRISIMLLATASTVFAVDAATTQVTTGQLGDATQNLDNPMGAAYRGIVRDNKMGIKGSITAVSAGDKGTEFAVDMSNLPSEGGPFLYHLHVVPVQADGNCTLTLGHLDPFIRGETPPCAMDRPETCQVGDLAGKHGKMNGTNFQATYTDPYVSLKEGMGSFFGNRSFVIHFANTTRIACGNFEALDAAAVGASPSSPVSSLPPLNPTATLIPAFSNNSAAATSGVVISNGTAVMSSNATAAITSPVLTAAASASLTTSTTFVSAPTAIGGQSSQTSSASPAQVSTSAASRSLLASSFVFLASFAAGLWCLL